MKRMYYYTRPNSKRTEGKSKDEEEVGIAQDESIK